MLRFLSDKSHRSPKLFFVGALVIFLIIIITGVLSTGSYTFFSKAEDMDRTITFEQASISPITIPSDDMPQCVVSMSYLPTRSDKICFSQFECAEESIPQAFCIIENELVTCEFPADECQERGQLIQLAADNCGCGDL